MGEHEQELKRQRDRIDFARISGALLRGNVRDAEQIAKGMFDPIPAIERIEAWKQQYADLPHGQWEEATNDT